MKFKKIFRENKNFMGYLKWFDYVLMVHTFLGIGYSLKDFVYRPKTTSKI